MDLMQRERDRVLQRSARVYGLCFTVVSLLCLSIPGAVGGSEYWLCLPLYVALAVCQLLMGASRPLVWAPLSVLLGLAIEFAIAFGPVGDSAQAALLLLAGGSLASVSLVFATSAFRLIALIGVFLLVTLVTVGFQWDTGDTIASVSALVVGWGLATLVGLWVSAATPRAARRVATLGRAHRAERQSSELEAQRRQGARLLHDTVLATLTLLAHSGVGVQPEMLRQQAGDDARLLRQLRLGLAPSLPSADAAQAVGPAVAVEESQLGTTLESVKQRFGRMGLEVSWHGTGQVLLPSHVLDAFLMALAECLENVRRHSGVTQAHVTITDDEQAVRAMVTDSGKGFRLDDVGEHKLGFKESVVGRLSEVGGSARLFSAPGQGTTVVLEVPR